MDATTFMPMPTCNVHIGRMKFHHPDQEKARKFAKRPNDDAKMGMLIGGIMTVWASLFWIYNRWSAPAPVIRPGQQYPRKTGLITRILPYLMLATGVALIASATTFITLTNKMLDDPALSSDCV